VRRILVLGTALVFITGLAFLTFRAISDQGITLLTLLSVLILAVLAIGIVGALRNPPR
jgi:ABC-type transport system involved in cytochrome c biogenesis permease subunit